MFEKNVHTQKRRFMSTAKNRFQLYSFHVFLGASLMIHAALLMLPLKTHINSPAKSAHATLFAVELLMQEQPPESQTPVQEPAPALRSPAPVASPPPPAKTRTVKPSSTPKKNQAREATVSLDRMHEADTEYRSYLGHLRSKINAVWHYPPEASGKGLNGMVTVRFSIARNGSLKSLSVTNSSAHRLLDDEALRTIRAAAPFHPFPGEFTIEKMNVLASFEYEFSGR